MTPHIAVQLAKFSNQIIPGKSQEDGKSDKLHQSTYFSNNVSTNDSAILFCTERDSVVQKLAAR